MTIQNQNLPLESVHRLLATQNLSHVPDSVCSVMCGDACVIWKPSRALAEQSPMDCDGNAGRLYPYSSNFGAKEAIQHAGIPMDITNDTTGRFYTSGKEKHLENDFLSKDEDSPSDSFMRAQDLRKLCLARFKMPDSSKGDFVAAVYRRNSSEVFTEQDSLRLRDLARFLPMLYQRLVASQLQSAIVKVNEILGPRCLDLKAAEVPLGDLCEGLAASFSTREVSVFMCEGIPGIDEYRLYASTLSRSEMRKHSYRADTNDGLTGYVLKTARLIWFHDLHNFEYDERRVLIENRYSGIRWTDGAAFGRLAKQMFGLSEKDLNPPLPFVAVPVMGEHGNVLGVIRSSLGTNPFHFLHEQVEAFRIIANEIGRWWESILYGVEQQRRADVWQALDNTITKQHNTLKRTENIEGLIAGTVQSIVEQPGFSLAAFRRGEDEASLRLDAFCLSAQEKGRPSRQTNPPVNSSLPLDSTQLVKPEMIRGFYVGKLERNANNIKASSSTAEAAVFHGMSWLLSCPVYIRSKLYGVLDVGFENERDYFTGKNRIQQFVELTARQLALFVRISESVAEVEDAKNRELRTYAVVTHQLKTPLFTASRRLRGLASIAPGNWNDTRAKMLVEVAGMVRKARGVTNTIEAIGKLISGEAVKAKCYAVKAEDAWKLSLEVARNVRVLSDKEMNLSFRLDPDDWGVHLLQWEEDFAEQCLDAVISNAFKYSALGEEVRIIGMPSGTHYSIKIINVGKYVIREEDLEKCKEQGWRGPQAHDQEGVGIGLWIADQWMIAQGGELKVYATNRARETQIELRFASRRLV